MVQVWNPSGNMAIPNSVPLPRTSRTTPMKNSAKVNPTPMPRPSMMARPGLFLEAKASARPRIRQFTTIRAMNAPSARCSSMLIAMMA